MSQDQEFGSSHRLHSIKERHSNRSIYVIYGSTATHLWKMTVPMQNDPRGHCGNIEALLHSTIVSCYSYLCKPEQSWFSNLVQPQANLFQRYFECVTIRWTLLNKIFFFKAIFQLGTNNAISYTNLTNSIIVSISNVSFLLSLIKAAISLKRISILRF